ncbi:MAG: aminomethyl-transferring glycine dehydrogenase subunit GcvPA [Proteobacteria bacterium]|nr:aminomethyl-transferring glycine dehydrogenase subunit GcvPA [Pseudomonadota bacterium]
MRYLPLTDADRRLMLERIGVNSVDDLFVDVPAAARLPGPLPALPKHLAEFEVERIIGGLAAKNLSAGACPSFLGAGAYRHHVPASVDQLLLRGEFLTSYTPYQPEVSQGTLQSLFEFQTQVALLTGMEVANASMYDGATACAEAVMMANRITRRGRALVSGGLHPHYREVIQTMADSTGFAVQALPPTISPVEEIAENIDQETACVVVQNPDFFGRLHDFTALAEICQSNGALLVVVVSEVVSLGLIKPPGAMGADIVVAEGQGIGNALGFGGPHVGLFACKEKYVRQMPGRLCGQTVDADGRRGYVLTLSTREQHIRREKATSNICTNSGLCALAFTIHLSLLGEEGLTRLAELNHALASNFADRITQVPGCRVLNESFFNEFTVELPFPAAALVDKMAKVPILAGVPVSRLYPDNPELENLLLVAVTELNQIQEMETFVQLLKEWL